MDETIIVYCERSTMEEELAFLTMVNNAQADGEISPQEATAMIDRQYELWALAD